MRKVLFIITVVITFCTGSVSLITAGVNDTINGGVVDSASNTPMDSVTVGSEGISTLTNTSGAVKLVIPTTGVHRMQRQNQNPNVVWNPRESFFSWSENSGPVSLTIHNLSGRIVARSGLVSQVSDHTLSIEELPQGIYLATPR